MRGLKARLRAERVAILRTERRLAGGGGDAYPPRMTEWRRAYNTALRRLRAGEIQRPAWATKKDASGAFFWETLYPDERSKVQNVQTMDEANALMMQSTRERNIRLIQVVGQLQQHLAPRAREAEDANCPVCQESLAKDQLLDEQDAAFAAAREKDMENLRKRLLGVRMRKDKAFRKQYSEADEAGRAAMRAMVVSDDDAITPQPRVTTMECCNNPIHTACLKNYILEPFNNCKCPFCREPIPDWFAMEKVAVACPDEDAVKRAIIEFVAESSDDESASFVSDAESSDRNMPPLHIAAKRGLVREVEMLLEADTQDSDNEVDSELFLHNNEAVTPMWLAASEGHDRIVDMLLQHGETVYEGGVYDVAIDDADEIDGFTPLGIAALRGHVAVVDRLLAAGANTSRGRGSGPGAPLHLAAERGHLAVVERLLQDDRVDIDIARRFGRHGATPLWNAAKSGHADVVRALVLKGADRTLATLDGITPLDIAANIDIVSELVQFPLYFSEDPDFPYVDHRRGSTMTLDGREFKLNVHNEDMDGEMILDGTDRKRVQLSFTAMDESSENIEVYHKRWFFRGSRMWSSDRIKEGNQKDGFLIDDFTSDDALVGREVASIPGTEEMLEKWYEQSSVDPWGDGVTEDEIGEARANGTLIPSFEHIRKLLCADRAAALRAIIVEIGGTPMF